MKHHTLNIISFVLVSNTKLSTMASINETHKECVCWGGGLGACKKFANHDKE